tara:strand:- start:1595 stop:1822 length:228 start_codon:yes stop_codon:yes gene_type:complete
MVMSKLSSDPTLKVWDVANQICHYLLKKLSFFVSFHHGSAFRLFHDSSAFRLFRTTTLNRWDFYSHVFHNFSIID